MKLKIKLDPGAYMPTRAHRADAGLDLYSRERRLIWPGMSVMFDTGVHIAIPEGYVGDVDPKSSLMEKNLLTAGTIDCGYTGSIKIKLFNLGGGMVEILEGQKIAQLVIKSIITPELEVVDSLEETERGDGGFGSTGAYHEV